MRVKLRYVLEFRDRHGKLRRYYRRGGVRVPLPGVPGSNEFMEAYREGARRYEDNGASIGSGRTLPGSLDALVASYYKSAAYLGLRDSTRRTYRNEIERLRQENGNKPVRRLERSHVMRMMDEKARISGIEAANNRLRVLRLLLRHALDIGMIEVNPAADIRKLRSKSTGFHSWTESEIARYEGRWPVGTRERLAFDLMLYTAQRRSDVVRMGRQHLRNGAIQVRQQKTGRLLEIPLHPALLASVSAAPRDQMTFLVTSQSAPFSAAGFGNWFREVCDATGLKHCSAHGLRKAAARRLAEAGCTTNQIGAVTGHTSLVELQRYVAAAEQKHLAQAAMRTVFGTQSEQKLTNRDHTIDKPFVTN